MKNRIRNIKASDYFKKANLHCHSKFSDGACDFDSLVEQAHELGLEHFSICDHNTVEGYLKSKYKDDPILLRGVEFDCFVGFCFVHILGYGFDLECKEFQDICAKHKIETQKNPLRIVYARNPKTVIEAIHKAGGIAILAHPCCYYTFSLEKLVGKLVDVGLDGMEIYYPYKRHRKIVKFHSRKKAYQIAQKFNLLLTGGEDNHSKLYSGDNPPIK